MVLFVLEKYFCSVSTPPPPVNTFTVNVRVIRYSADVLVKSSAIECRDGEFASHPTDCNKYLQCLWGKFNTNSCPGGLHWNNVRPERFAQTTTTTTTTSGLVHTIRLFDGNDREIKNTDLTCSESETVQKPELHAFTQRSRFVLCDVSITPYRPYTLEIFSKNHGYTVTLSIDL